MEKTKSNDLQTCPYNRSHKVLLCRMAAHLLRCAKAHKDSDLVHCPYNILHVLKKEELDDHKKKCICGPEDLTREIVKPVSTEPQYNLVPSVEDWDLDPPVETYNPQEYCKNNRIVRASYGESRVSRRRFRSKERKRFGELQ